MKPQGAARSRKHHFGGTSDAIQVTTPPALCSTYCIPVKIKYSKNLKNNNLGFNF
jgi:hypothetical protein